MGELKNKAQEALGSAEEKWGELTDNEKLTEKGQKEQAASRARQAAEQARAAAEDARRSAE